MQRIKIEKPFKYNYKESGNFSFITRDADLLSQVTNRENVCLKVFKQSLQEPLESYIWGYPFDVIFDNEGTSRAERSYLLEAVRIQNLCAFNGLAPRVYDIILIEYLGKEYPAILVEDMKDFPVVTNELEKLTIIDKIRQLGEELGFKTDYEDLGQYGNFMGEKFLDFQGYHFEENYRERMIERYKAKATWSGNTYQSIEELGIEGYRATEERKLLMKLDEHINFKNQIIWDIGCSGGAFTRYAVSKGARVSAIDFKEVIEATREINNYLDCFNVDYYGLNLELNKDYNFGLNPDVIFYLSVYRYFEYAPYLKRARAVVYEHNGDTEPEIVLETMKKDFPIIIDLGKTGKNDDRHTYILKKDVQ